MIFLANNGQEYCRAIAVGLGAKGFLGTVYLDLGLLHKNNKRTNQARKCILEAINIFQESGAEEYLNQAKEALEHLKAKM